MKKESLHLQFAVVAFVQNWRSRRRYINSHDWSAGYHCGLFTQSWLVLHWSLNCASPRRRKFIGSLIRAEFARSRALKAASPAPLAVAA